MNESRSKEQKLDFQITTNAIHTETQIVHDFIFELQHMI